MLTQQLTDLKNTLIAYARFVRAMVEQAMQSLVQPDAALLRTIIDTQEPRTNAIEMELEEQCITAIAQLEPKAKDLRTVLMILKMNSDLERMGDHAANIAESALYLVDRPLVKPLSDLPRMSDMVGRMLADSIAAFVNEDVALAKSVCARDDIIDGLKQQVIRELITCMSTDAHTIERALNLLRIANNLERIADLTTNICEELIYIVEGTVIKHNVDTRAPDKA